MRRALRSSILIVGMMLLACVSTGCEDWGETVAARDFNELIPRMMGAIEKSSPEQAATNLFNVTSPDERREAIAYLQVQPYGHRDAYMRAYRLLATDPSPLVRAQAMRAFGTAYTVDAVPDLVKGLADPEAVVRRDAATALWWTYGDAAWLPLSDIVQKDADDQTRIQAARALTHANGSKEAIGALIAALNDRKDSAVCFYAREALYSTTMQDFGYDSKAWAGWYQQTYNPTTSTAPPSGPASGPTTRP